MLLEHKTGSSALCNTKPSQVLINIMTRPISEKTKSIYIIKKIQFRSTGNEQKTDKRVEKIKSTY